MSPVTDVREAARAGWRELLDDPRRRRFGWWLAGALFVSAVLCVIPGLDENLGLLAMTIGLIYAGIAMISRAGSHERREAMGWRLIGLGMLASVAGVLAVAVLSVAGFEPPAFGPLDGFFVSSYALVIAGLATMPHVAATRTQRLRITFDALVGAVAMAVLVWVTVASDLIHGSAPGWQVALGFGYAALDLTLLLAITVVTLRRSTMRFDLRMTVLAVGFSVQAVADLTYLRQGVGSSFDQVHPLYSANVLAIALFVTAACLVHRAPLPRDYDAHATPWWSLVWPYLAVGGLIAALVGSTVGSSATPKARQLTWGTVLVGVLLFIRQQAAIRENRELVEQRRAALVSSVSHELKTPLAAVVGYLALLEGRSLDQDTQAEVIDMAKVQADYLSQIVGDLMDLAKEQNGLSIRESEVEVAPVVRRATKVAAGAESVAIAVDDNLVARLDPGRLQQVVGNLVSNAIHYGGGRRSVLVEARGQDLIVEVHDDGSGVAKRDETVIWQRFERGSQRHTSRHQGTGIGLAVVAEIAVAHGGRASYRRSELLGGACFSVVFPERVITSRSSVRSGRR